MNLYNQTDEAEAIDSALVKRAAVEALNVADRQVDLAWLAEGDKVNGQMERFRRNIDRILLCGGTPDERERWEEYYQVYQCAINATKDAYMPNAQRKKEYLRISKKHSLSTKEASCAMPWSGGTNPGLPCVARRRVAAAEEATEKKP